MILTIDIGNTSVHFGIFSGKKLKKEWRIRTERLASKLASYRSIFSSSEKVIVSSVVPRLNRIIKKAFPQAIFVNDKNIGMRVKVKKPAEVGADRLVNAFAGDNFYGGPVIIVDFGTATTFDVVSKKGEYLGGAIAPGILLARDALYEQTAKLPKIKITAPRKVIGDDTVSALQSGLIYGYVALVEGMIKRFKKQNAELKSAKVIATGGGAKLICRYCKLIDYWDPFLTLKGLNCWAEKL